MKNHVLKSRIIALHCTLPTNCNVRVGKKKLNKYHSLYHKFVQPFNLHIQIFYPTHSQVLLFKHPPTYLSAHSTAHCSLLHSSTSPSIIITIFSQIYPLIHFVHQLDSFPSVHLHCYPFVNYLCFMHKRNVCQ